MERTRPRPFSLKFIVVLISLVLVGCYVMNRAHKGKPVLPVMPGSKSARIAEPEVAETPPQPAAADRELMYGSKSGAAFRSKDVVAGDQRGSAAQPANASGNQSKP